MAKRLDFLYLTISDGGTVSPSGTLSNNYAIPPSTYIIKQASGATGTLTAPAQISGTAAEGGTSYTFIFEDAFTTDKAGGDYIEIFGYQLSDEQAASKPIVFVLDTGSSFEVVLLPNFNTGSAIINVDNIPDGEITFAKLSSLTEGSMLVGNSSNVPAAKDFSPSGRIPIGDGTTLNSTAMSGDATINSSGVLTIANDAVDNNKLANINQGSVKIGGAANAPTDLDLAGAGAGAVVYTDGTDALAGKFSGDFTVDGTLAATIANDAITTVKILDDNVTVAKVSDNLKYDTKFVEVSFETGEVGDFDIRMDFAGTLVGIYAFATKAIAASNDGTIVPKDDSGTTMTAGTITFTASDPRGTAYTATPTANNTFVDGDVLTFTTAKTTAGGKVLLSLRFLRA